MDERFLNVSDDNTTSSMNMSSLSPEESTVSAKQIYICNLYQFVMTGVIQLIIAIIGLVGKSIETLCADYYLKSSGKNCKSQHHFDTNEISIGKICTIITVQTQWQIAKIVISL